tara:strand:+ start:46 stop:558 length:513 start_codon:yes stop_codon:yes gene_type:complete
MTKLKSKEPRVEDLYSKYPCLKGEFQKHWRSIVRKALQEQVRRNPDSNALRGMKEIAKTYFPMYLESNEWQKLQKMISQRFQSSKHSSDWDDWRESLPNIFPEKSVGKLAWFEDNEGVPESVSLIEEDEKKINEGCAVIIIQHPNFRNEYTNVPSEVALTINAEISKALS